MSEKIKILLIEHDINDIELILFELKKSGINYESIIVQDELGFKNELNKFKPDIVLSDYTFPAFDGFTAFKIKEKISPDTPFIFVSGTVGEEKAVELIKNGVTDYVLKDKIFSLSHKILRALKDAEKKKEKAITDEKLYKVNNLYAFISQVNQNILRIKDETTLFRNACLMAIEFGKFKMSWIGLFDFENKKISLVEQSGIAEKDLELFKNVAYHTEGAQDYVLRTGKYFICNDIRADFKSLIWKAFVLEHSIHSYIVLPVKKSDKIIGTFNLYSTERNFSDTDQIKLLIEVTDNISFALGLFEKEKKQKEADKQIILNEKQRQFNQNNLNALINNTKDLMWSVDRDFNLITSNKPFDEMAKINFGKVIEKGENVLSVAFSPEMYSHFKQLYERAFAGEVFTKIDYFGSPVELWSEISYSPIRKEDLIIGAACHLHDITEIKKIEQSLIKSEAFNRGVLDSLKSQIAVLDNSGTIIAVNESWNRFALENGETTLQFTSIGCNYFTICQKSFEQGDESAALVVTGIKEVLTEKVPVFNFEYPCHSPTELRWFKMRVTKFESDESMVVIEHQNITERKLKEKEREKLISSIAQHSKNLEQFTSIVSHNLRAPVANILGISNLLKNDITKEDRVRSQQLLFKATKQLDQTLKDLNKILQVRLEINEYKEIIHFSELVDTIKSSIHNIIKKEKVKILTDFSALDKIISIKSYMYSIFFNLISNSIKYRQFGKPTEIKIKSELIRGQIKISFKDNGVGIDLNKHGDKIFKIYKRFHFHVEGKGLGLFMVKTQVETLGGTIKVESTPGEGAEFIIELPL